MNSVISRNRRWKTWIKKAPRLWSRDAGDNVELEVIANDDAAAWRKLVQALPLRPRQVLIMKWDGYSIADIAIELGMDPGTVRSHLHTARKALKHHISGSEGRP